MLNYFVHPTAVIEEDVTIGEGSRIWHFVHVRRRAKIGRNCNIGKDVFIDVDVEIGDNVKIQNGVSIYRGVKIEDDVFLGPHMTFTNDLYPRAYSTDWQVIPTIVKKGASIGANATILCGVTIGRYAMVGAGAVVTENVPDFGLVYGNPARLEGFVCYCGRRVDKIIREDGEYVVFKCNYCGRSVEINREDYLRYLNRYAKS